MNGTYVLVRVRLFKCTWGHQGELSAASYNAVATVKKMGQRDVVGGSSERVQLNVAVK